MPRSYSKSRAIIWDGDRRHASFLELVLRHHERHTQVPCCQDFCRCSAGKWRPGVPKCLMLLTHNSHSCPIHSIRLCLLEYFFSIFFISCSSLSEASNLGMPRYTSSLTKLCSVPSFTRAPHYSTIYNVEAFPDNTAKT